MIYDLSGNNLLEFTTSDDDILVIINNGNTYNLTTSISCTLTYTDTTILNVVIFGGIIGAVIVGIYIRRRSYG